MNEREWNGTETGRIAAAVEAFYDAHPYPPPVDDLEGYRQRWQDERQAQPATAGCACGARILLCPRVLVSTLC